MCNGLYKLSGVGLIASVLGLLLFTSSCKNTVEDILDNEDILGFEKMDSITLQLEQIKVLFPAVEQWEEKGAIQYVGDTAFVYDRESTMLLEKPFSINIEATTSLVVEQQYETKLSIITSGEYIDLTKLKSYVSPWRKLTPDANNRYIKTAFSQEEIKRFPETPIPQVLEHLFWETRTTQSEFDWTKYLKQAKSIQEFPFLISINSITLRFSGEYLDGRAFEKYITFKLGIQSKPYEFYQQ